MPRLSRIVPLVALLVVASLALLAAQDATYRWRVETGDDPAPLVRRLVAEGLDVSYVDREAGVVELVGGEAVGRRLAVLGYTPEIVEDLSPGAPGQEALSDYLDPAEIRARLEQYAADYPDLTRLVTYAVTEEGRPVYAMLISDNADVDEDEPALLFVGQHHAREVMTPEVLLDIVDQLLTGYGVDPVLTRRVDEAEIWVVPSHNPDGAQYVFSSSPGWRKNRRDNLDGTFGVDPNRNYPFQWGGTVCNGSSGDTGSDTYRGPEAASEPETAGLMALAREQRPLFNVSYHTYGEYVIHPLGCDGQRPGSPDLRTYRELASAVSARVTSDLPGRFYRFGTGWELLYSVDGEMNDWFYAELGSFGFTFELNADSQGFQPDYQTWRDSTVERSRDGWRFFLDQLDGPRVTGHVRDACTGEPVVAGVDLSERTRPHGEKKPTSEPRFGRFDIPVLWGDYTLVAEQADYHGQNWPVHVGFGPARREIELVPLGSHGLAVGPPRVVEIDGDGDGMLDPGEEADLFFELYATGEAVTGARLTAVSDDPLLVVLDGSAEAGDLAAGERRETLDPVRVRIAPEAPDGHEPRLRITTAAAESLCGPEQQAVLRVTRGAESCPEILEPLDADPGWSIDNSTGGGWEFGAPSGVGGPSAGATGTTIYGTNLSGDYGADGLFVLTAGPFDLATLRAPELRFQRWLETQVGRDLARVELVIGAGGEPIELWRGFGRDDRWVELRYDLAGLADFESEVYVRFVLETDASGQQPGFHVDDISFCGERVPGPGGKVRYATHRVDDLDPAYGNGNGVLDVGETATLVVTVENTSSEPATLVSGLLESATTGITVHNDWAAFPDLAAGAAAESLAPHFTVTAEGDCGAVAVFALTTRWSDGRSAESRFSVPVGQETETTVLASDFEAPSGWTAGGSAVRGGFVREDPHGVDAGGAPVQPEDDHTADPGALCWVTGNPPVGPGFDPADGDLDRGTAYIDSPEFDGTGAETLPLRFARWFHRSGVGFLNEARYRAQVSNDGGTSWRDIDSLEIDASTWTVVEIDLASRIVPTDRMRLRFLAREVQRVSGDPLVELLIDDVSVVSRASICEPFTSPDGLPPDAVGPTLRLRRDGSDLRLEWSAPPAGPSRDPARFYPVWRSARADGGFGMIGEPTAPFLVEPDGGLPLGGHGFFLVSARNAAGESGEAPSP